MTRPGSVVIEPGVAGRERPRIDGATLVILYLLSALIIPARLIVSNIPLTLPPSLAIALGLGVLWFAAQFLSTVGIGKGHNLIRAALGIYFATQLMTYAVATRRGLPGDELSVADSSLIRIVGMVALAVFICDGLRTRDRLDRVLKVLVAAASFVACVGLVQFALGIDLASYISIPGLSSHTTYSAIEQRSGLRRPTGTTNHPIEFGLLCAAVLPLAIHFGFSARRAGAPSARWWACAGLLTAGATVALSRTAILGLIIGGLVLILGTPDRRKYLLAVVGPVFLVGASAAVPGLLGTLYGMFSFIGSDSSVTSRTDDYANAFATIAQNPMLGRGFGTYISYKYGILDNQYLLTMIENGYIGLGAVIILFLAAVIAGIRVRIRCRDVETQSLGVALVAAVAAGIVGAATFDMFGFSVATGLMFVLIGACGALVRCASFDRQPHGARPLTSNAFLPY